MKKLLLLLTISIFLIPSCSKDEKDTETPNADFETSTDTYTVGQSISFQNKSTGADSYEWDFGDTKSSTNKSPFHTYTSIGYKTVTLTAYSEDQKINSSKTRTLNIISSGSGGSGGSGGTGGSGGSGGGTSLPTKCFVTGVRVTKYPQTNNGSGWDLNGYPDIFYKIVDANNNILYADESKRKENYASQTATWNLPSGTGVEINLNQDFYIYLYDYDPTSADDYMSGCGGESPNDWISTTPPSSINWNCNDMNVTVYLVWN